MESYLGELKDVTLGQDFLTWLWRQSEAQNGLFKDAQGRDFALYIEQRVRVQGGEGESLETATVSGPMSELREARLGLGMGKKVSRALARIERDAETWQVALRAEDFALNSLKTPKVEPAGQDDDPDAVFLEKMSLIEQCLELLDGLYKDFLERRLSSRWPDELRDIREWLQQAGA